MQILLESKIEKDVVKWAETVNILVVKMNLLGRRGWPDRLFVLPNGGILWVEFKRPGKTPEDLQDYVHRKLREHRQDVYVATRAFDTISYIKARMGAALVSEEGNPNDAPAGVRRVVSGSGSW